MVSEDCSLAEGLVKITLVHDGATSYFGGNSNLEAFVESKFFDLDGYSLIQTPIGNFEKTLTGVRVELGEDTDDISTVQFYVGVKQRLKDTPVWYGPYSLEDGDDIIHLLDVEDGRYFAFRIIDPTPISIWSMSAMEIFGSIGEGRY